MITGRAHDLPSMADLGGNQSVVWFGNTVGIVRMFPELQRLRSADALGAPLFSHFTERSSSRARAHPKRRQRARRVGRCHAWTAPFLQGIRLRLID